MTSRRCFAHANQFVTDAWLPEINGIEELAIDRQQRNAMGRAGRWNAWSRRLACDSFQHMGLHVLVVSPDEARRAALTAALVAAGHRAAGAESGAVGAAALTEPGLDAVIVDLHTPELDSAALRAALDPATPVAPDSLEDAERRHIAQVLQHTGGNKRQASLLLGISRSTLLHKVRKYHIVTSRS